MFVSVAFSGDSIRSQREAKVAGRTEGGSLGAQGAILVQELEKMS